MGKLVAAMAALVIAILLVYNGLWPNYRTKVNGPESTIGKSGEMKSPACTQAIWTTIAHSVSPLGCTDVEN
jgi:hypothetical protein